MSLHPEPIITEASPGEMLVAALSYAARNWKVFPAPPGQKKSHKNAAYSGGRKWGATSDPEEIRRDWKRWPSACIGIATGRTSGVFVVEVDTLKGHGIDGIAALKALEAEHGELPETRTAVTPSGSMHFYFQYPSDREVRNSTSRLATAIDVRAEGGMVIAPPSNRPGKGCYRWVNEGAIATAPEWLLILVTGSDRGPGTTDEPAETGLAGRASEDLTALENDAGAGLENYHPVTLKEIEAALAAIGSDCERDKWFSSGCSLFRHFGSEEGFAIWDRWSKKGKKYPGGRVMREQWDSLVKRDGYSTNIATLFFHADKTEPNWRQLLSEDQHDQPAPLQNLAGGTKDEDPKADDVKSGSKGQRASEDHHSSVTLNDFYAYMPAHNYIYVPTREPWPSSSVNARIKPVAAVDASGKAVLNADKTPKFIAANTWLDKHRPVEQMIWVPGEPELIRDRLLTEGGWVERKKARALNLYRPPSVARGNAASAGPWIDHVKRVYGDQTRHLIQWFAHRVQRPGEKINHAIVLGGEQGIGKDTIIEAVKYAVGPWNFSEVSPPQMMGRFNGFIKSVVMRISEARDEGSEVNRYQFYEHLKTLTAAPPDVLRCDEKNLREHYVFNVTGVIITTNHKASGIYLPAGDRRHFVAWSDCELMDFDEAYWRKIWGWYHSGGLQHVAAYLAELDISTFNPKAPPPKTAAFWDIVDANRAPEEAELADVFDRLFNPPAVTIAMIRNVTQMGDGAIGDWIRDRRNRRTIPHRLHEAGYDPVRNPDVKDGMWKIGDARLAVYARRELPIRDQIDAAQELAKNKM
jgi:hypothetical protein